MATTLLSTMNAKLSQHRFWRYHKNQLIKTIPIPYSNLDSPGYNLDWPTAVAGEADSVSSTLASACHIGGPI